MLVSSANPSLAGEAVTFTVEVTVLAAGEPIGFRQPANPPNDGGSVTISDGDIVLALLTLDDGRASYTTSSLTPGAHRITAAFSGAATAAPSTDVVVQQIDGAALAPGSLPVTGNAISPLVGIIGAALFVLGCALISQVAARTRSR
jgi:Big-like domain-containing protein